MQGSKVVFLLFRRWRWIQGNDQSVTLALKPTIVRTSQKETNKTKKKKRRRKKRRKEEKKKKKTFIVWLIMVGGGLNRIKNHISTLFSQVGYRMQDFSGRNAVSIFVHNTECLLDLLLTVCSLYLPLNHSVHNIPGDLGELWEVHEVIAISVDVDVDCVLQLRLC